MYMSVKKEPLIFFKLDYKIIQEFCFSENTKITK